MVTMLPKVVTAGSIPMTGVVVGFVIVLVEDTDHLEVEEEQEGDGDPEQGPQVDPDAQEVVFIEEPDRFRLGHLDEAVKTLSLSLSLLEFVRAPMPVQDFSEIDRIDRVACILYIFRSLWHIFAEKCSFACVSCYLPFPNTGVYMFVLSSCYLPFPNTGAVFHKH